MKNKHLIIVIILNLFIAIAFFVSNLDAKVTDISSDLANILPICKKLDNPVLYQNDLYLGEIDNVKYYTPFYVEILRFIAKFTHFDYVKALNILALITHFIYGMTWFYLLFLIKRDFFTALLFSIFMRGIIWPPGMELLGIADLWTIMPRTVFSALIPLPFIIYKFARHKTFMAAIVLGLLVNFHPISGIGAIIIYVSLFFFNNYFNGKAFELIFLKEFLIIILLIFIGMTPYFFIYFKNVKSVLNIDQELFEIAIRARIDESFFDSFVFLKSWNHPYAYFFGLAFIFFYFFDSSIKKINFKVIFFTILILLVFCNSISFFENQINSLLHLNFRFAFQLIRAQKLVIVLLQVSMFLLIIEFINYFKINNFVKVGATFIYFFLLSISSAPFFNSFPLIGDDISRLSLPNNLKIYPFKKQDLKLINEVFDFVNINLPSNTLFYCENIYFRAATNRSEVLDFHAAGMLIEGNPQAYINAYKSITIFNKSSYLQKITFLKQKKVDYIIVKNKWNSLNLIFRNKDYYVYKL